MACNKKYGFGKELTSTSMNSDVYIIINHNLVDGESEAMEIIKGVRGEARQAFSRESVLLVQFAKVLADQPSLHQEQILELVMDYGTAEIKK
ncbi:hypothetical protein [Algoriphagus antarcticus]|uniref:Uncharacterized protein n=1 Tax=Algoriphagus antarcticus TaxID=238540 RepID=A0A3E0DS58_9BACT|nr:hypothetical protein [Algoriphagus antarcticus]REG85323.1 hypothetical protein C8N25_11310 [Algoriphagus antarcticus]